MFVYCLMFLDFLLFQTIIEEIKNCVALRRHFKSRCSISLNEIKSACHLSQKAKKDLVSQIDESGVVSVE